jgi:hypothetical protein
MFDLTRLAIPYMPKGSSIINVGSVQALVFFSFSSPIKKKYLISVINHHQKFLITLQQKLPLLDLLNVRLFESI